MNHPRRAAPSRRQVLQAGVAGATALALAGFGDRASRAGAAGPVASYPPRNPQVAGEKANLAVWLTPELASHPSYKTAISLFQRAYPGLKVAVTPVSKSDIPARLKVAIAGGGAPDLVSHHAYIFGAQGLAHESDALWYAWGQEASFLPGAMRDVQWRNDKFGVPLVGNAILTLLNAEMFARAGAPLPTGATTFGQFTTLVEKVKRHAGSPYALLLSADGATATAVVHANGARLMQTVAGRNIARLSDPRVAQGLRFYTELGWKQRLAPLPPSGPTNRLYLAQQFAARRAPAFFGTMADLALIEAAAPDVRVALAPLPGGVTGHTAGSVSDGLSLFVPAPSHRPHAAFELAKWLVAPPPALAVARTLRLAPTVARYYEDAYFHHDAPSRAYFTAAQTAWPIGLDAYAEAYDLYLGALRAAFGGQDVTRALAGAQERVQAAMDRSDAGIEGDG